MGSTTYPTSALDLRVDERWSGAVTAESEGPTGNLTADDAQVRTALLAWLTTRDDTSGRTRAEHHDIGPDFGLVDEPGNVNEDYIAIVFNVFLDAARDGVLGELGKRVQLFRTPSDGNFVEGVLITVDVIDGVRLCTGHLAQIDLALDERTGVDAAVGTITEILIYAEAMLERWHAATGPAIAA
jgi:hypothetical protein